MGSPRIPSWRLADLLRFEQLRIEDESHSSQELLARDHRIFQELGTQHTQRPALFRLWLRSRQKAPPSNSNNPEFLLHWLGILVFLLGILTGSGMTRLALGYDGSVPINILWAWGLLVLPQSMLLALLLVLLVMRLFGSDLMEVAYRIPSTWLRWAIRGLWSQARKRWVCDPNQRRRLETRAEAWEALWVHYRAVLFVRVGRLAQTYGIAFNVGILFTSLLLLAISDRAFGWQSTISRDPGQLHRVVRWIASPWSDWMGVEPGHPSLDQVRDSYTLLGHSIQTMPAAALHAWWSFLMFSVLFYGLVPRCLTWIGFVVLERRALSKLRFERHTHQPLWERMHTRILETSGSQSSRSTGSSPIARAFDLRSEHPRGSCRLFTPAGLSCRLDLKELPILMEGLLNCPVLAASGDFDPDLLAPGEIPLIAIEAWQPPILELMDSLKSWVVALAKKENPPCHLLLLGRPQHSGWAELSPIQREVWMAEIRKFEIPSLVVVPACAATTP